MAYVVIVAGPHRGEVKPVMQEFLVISRFSEGGDKLNLGNDEFVSRADPKANRLGHAVLQKIDGIWRLTNCGSLNKTWVILNNAFNPLAAKAFVRMRPVFLFGCGMSGLLFLDVEAEPSEALRKDLCGTDRMHTSHPADAPTPTKVIASTETNPTPLSDASAALARWSQITATLKKHAMDDLL